MADHLSGATNYRGQFAVPGEGQGNGTGPALYAVNPVEPYNTTSMLVLTGCRPMLMRV